MNKTTKAKRQQREREMRPAYGDGSGLYFDTHEDGAKTHTPYEQRRRLMEALEQQARPGRPVVVGLPPYDVVEHTRRPLLARELWVYDISEAKQSPYGVAYNGRGIWLEHADYLYADWRRDEYGWVDFELTRQEAYKLLARCGVRVLPMVLCPVHGDQRDSSCDDPSAATCVCEVQS